MPVNSLHPEHAAALPVWSRAREVLLGEDAIKRAGSKYLPKLDGQTKAEFDAYVARASFFNATARTLDGFMGLMFRRSPSVSVPENLKAFVADVDLQGSTIEAYANQVAMEVLAVGRGGTLVDWTDSIGGRSGGSGASRSGSASRTGNRGDGRVYAAFYAAEAIKNWAVARVDGRMQLVLLVLGETVKRRSQEDEFEPEEVEQLRVFRLVQAGLATAAARELVVEVWQLLKADKADAREWRLVETTRPTRRGLPLPEIPFVFHGPRTAKADVEKLPLADIIAVNLDHYRLNAEYKHGLHFTALPTAWVAGFKDAGKLRIGSSTAWVSETLGATAGFLEFKGAGLTTFESAMDRDERLMALLGSRMLEDSKRVGETAQAIELRQSGESSALQTLAQSLSESLTHVLRWAYWWLGTEKLMEDVPESAVAIALNTDFSITGLSAQEVTALVGAWQAGAISQDTMMDVFRRGELIPATRNNEEEARLAEKRKAESGKSETGRTSPQPSPQSGEGGKTAKGNQQ